MFLPETPVAETTDREETMWGTPPRDPEALLLQTLDSEMLERLMQRLPPDYREVLLLREVEDLSYKEIATVTGVPIGTVMSRLARARLALRRLWLAETTEERADGV